MCALCSFKELSNINTKTREIIINKYTHKDNILIVKLLHFFLVDDYLIFYVCSSQEFILLFKENDVFFEVPSFLSANSSFTPPLPTEWKFIAFENFF